MVYNQILVFKSDNKELIMDKNSEFKNIDIQGIEASNYTINTSSSQYDGADIDSKKVEPREITITGDIKKNENELINRDFLIRFFNPKVSGVMYITRNHIKRKIEYEVEDVEFPTNKMSHYIQFTIILNCVKNPYFSDQKTVGGRLTAISPQFTFPLVILKNRPKIMGYKTYDPIMPIINDGDKEIGMEIIAVAKRGKVDNLKIILNNKEYIKVNVSLAQGDELRINTNPKKKSVLLNNKNIINKIDRNSTFFYLKKGKNILSYECDNGETNIEIQIETFREFLGV